MQGSCTNNNTTKHLAPQQLAALVKIKMTKLKKLHRTEICDPQIETLALTFTSSRGTNSTQRTAWTKSSNEAEGSCEHRRYFRGI